jgi:hypothetical protein
MPTVVRLESPSVSRDELSAGRASASTAAVDRDAIAIGWKEAEIRERLFLFERAEEVAHVGSWVWDATTDQITWSEGSRRIFGIAPGS